MTDKFLKPRDLVLVTGGCGYVGSHLVRMLLERGYRVRVLDNFLYGNAGLKGVGNHPDLDIQYGDICNIRDMMRAAKGARAVIALAALVGDGACDLDHDETISINIESTKLLCHVVKHRPDLERVVFASSCSVYGATEGLILNEGSRLNPVSFYARSRIVSEQILQRELEGRGVVILRLGTVFGTSARPRFDLMINTMTCKAVSEGAITVMGAEAWRPHVHVRDVAEAFLIAAETCDEHATGEIFNVGSNDNNFTIARTAEIVAARIPGTRIENVHRVDDLRSYRVSFDKIRHVLGFVPSRSIEQGVDEIKALLEKSPHMNWTDARYSNLKWLQAHGFAGEGRDCVQEVVDEAIGEVA
ncbi:MAG TPA: SDR family oxidoreductase [Candidatus Limnocylindrales bacterium]|nr:SDR family oxidoreductase [Candidatus Limnocylindrales bacterium]